jgi:hypothetical protein
VEGRAWVAREATQKRSNHCNEHEAGLRYFFCLEGGLGVGVATLPDRIILSPSIFMHPLSIEKYREPRTGAFIAISMRVAYGNVYHSNAAKARIMMFKFK